MVCLASELRFGKAFVEKLTRKAIFVKKRLRMKK